MSTTECTPVDSARPNTDPEILSGTTPPDSGALATCPFCGGDEAHVVTTAGGGGEYRIECGRCHSHGPTAESSLAARDNWNRHRGTRPANPLVDGVPSETLERVSDLLLWRDWHPLRNDVEPAEQVVESLRLADSYVSRMMREAIAHAQAHVTAVA